LESFEKMADHFKHLFRVRPEIIAHDLHPDYLSTQYAIHTTPPASCLLHPVQHHHAHIAACMAENGVAGPVIGVALDGTGYGDDGHIWGGEFLVADFVRYSRVSHLEYLPLPGGDAAVRKPWRIAAGYAEALGLDIDGLPFLNDVSEQELCICRQQAAKGLNAPLTSSMGRLFDCVAALANIRTQVSYEGQAAMELEQSSSLGLPWTAVQGRQITNYKFKIEGENILVGELLAAVIDDVRRGASAGEISAKFHGAVSDLILAVCQRERERTGIHEAALSGGVFQNVTLLEQSVPLLRQAGFTVYTHKLVPPNDGGIALGQAMAANANAEWAKTTIPNVTDKEQDD
jgi:hydrogenase maturation protein HypF